MPVTTRSSKRKSDKMAQEAVRPPSPTKFPFTKLPAELRLMIYKHALPITAQLDPCHECGHVHDAVDYEKPLGNKRRRATTHAILINSGTIDWEPDFFVALRTDNLGLYMEAAEVFYQQSTFNIVVDDMSLEPLNDFLTRLNNVFGRSRMLRHLNLCFEGVGGWNSVYSFLKTKEDTGLATDCQLSLVGVEEMITLFEHNCRLGERLRKGGLGWDSVCAALDEQIDCYSIVKGDEDCWAGYDESEQELRTHGNLNAHSYAYDVLARL